MKEQLRSEWVTLIQEGVQGQATRFRLRATRLAQTLGKSDPELAEALIRGLGSSSDLTRLAPLSADAPDLVAVEDLVRLPCDPYWPRETYAELKQIVNEWRAQEQLAEANLSPAKTILLYGPPGVGKTLSARWMAKEIGLPLATLNLAATVSSFLGKTGQNIAKVLEYARSRPCVLFLDEFDALAKRRDDAQDVGELKRIVNVLLQAVDQWSGPSMLIAATNHVDLLDVAMLRRFEVAIEFPPASSQQINHILKQNGVPSSHSVPLSKRLQNRPISDTDRLLNSARKKVVLDDVEFISALNLAENELFKNQAKKAETRAARVKALSAAGKSSHQIAKDLGVSHTTVLRDLKKQ